MASLKPAKRVQGVTAYSVPRHPAPCDLDLRGNEGARPDPALCGAVRGVEVLRTYPDTAEVRDRLAQWLGVDPETVLVTAGGDDALDRLCRATLEEGRTLVMPLPGFEMTKRYARLAGAEVVGVDWPGSEFPLQGVLDAIDDRTGLVALTSPNNPTGAVIAEAELDAVCEAAAAVGAMVLVDLAYVEFASVDLTKPALKHGNTAVLRTLSKAWGLAGTRVGCMVAPPEVLGWMAAAGAPFAVAGPSLAIAAAALDAGDAGVRDFVQTVTTGRAALSAALRDFGCDVVASEANFVFARSPRVTWLADGLAGLGVGVRTFPDKPGLEDAVRVAVPPEAEDIDRVVAGIAAVGAPEAVLLDMDGVLVDVSTSYRRAIVETAAEFGVTVTSADISAAKAAGDANNDWVLTWRLVQAGGGDASLSAVTEAFERRYQGGPDHSGLWATERLLVDQAWFARLKDKARVGVVTGRPRRDAERLLGMLGVDVEVMVTMEDGPAKPDPAPVRTALQRMGVTRAWMVGDTPDDIRAARAAAVVPLGIPAPGDTDPASLWASGAARVLDDLDQLLELLP